MQSYYDILGISQSAGNNEIKTAFRRLAKLYHPDKNPDGKEHFERILIAYEVLIDHSRRRQYDLKLKHGRHAGTQNTTKSNTKKKEWNFTDDEMKRRQYYKENYKKEYQKAQYRTPVYDNRKVYNEYKYILFAAPLAVALLLFIVNGFEREEPVVKKEIKDVHTPLNRNGESPYNTYFHDPQFDQSSEKKMSFENPNKMDAVLCLFNKDQKFIRCTYLQAGYRVEMSQLPLDSLETRIVFGNRWNPNRAIKARGVLGSFDSVMGYYSIKNSLAKYNTPIVLNPDSLKLNNKISEEEYFRKN